MLPLFARAGVSMIPGASRLPFLGGGGRSQEIPSLTLTLPSVRVDRDKLTAYSRVCGFSVSDTLPPTYPHILAFPLHLALMTDSTFPFPAIGLVHIAKSITQRRPVRADEELSLRVWPTELEPHPRGQQFSIRTEASVNGEVVWEEVSTNLRRAGGLGRALALALALALRALGAPRSASARSFRRPPPGGSLVISAAAMPPYPAI